MKYAVLLYQDEAIWANATGAEQQRYLEQHTAFDKTMVALGITMVSSEALRSVTTATTLRRRGDDVTVTDGPFAETAEQFGGFYLVDAPSLDAVLEAVRVLPEYTVEIRPVANVE